MAGLTGKTVATTYHSLLKVSSTDNQNFDTTLRDIVDGEDTASCLKLATDKATVTLGTDAGDDFLVTGSSASNALVVEGESGQVGIGISAPTDLLHVYRNDSSTASMLKLENDGTGDVTMQFLTTSDTAWSIGQDNSHSANAFVIAASAVLETTPIATFQQNGNVGIGTASPAFQLELEGSAASEMSLTRTGVLSNDDEIGAYTFTTIADTVAKVAAHRESSTSNAYMVFYTEATSESMTEKMRITSTGNVGIGCADPGAISTQVSSTVLEVRGTVTSATSGFTGAGELRLSSASTDVGDGDVLGVISFQAAKDDTGTDSFLPSAAIWCEGDGTFDADYNGGEIVFATANSENAIATAQERMRIDETGKVGIGKTDPGEKFNVTGDASGGTALVQFENTHSSVVDNDHVLMLAFSGQANAAEGNFIIFRDNDTDEMGVIKAADGSVVVDAYSDYRIKNTIATLSGGLTRVNALRPVTFKYNTDSGNATHEGFIAHEVQEHVPYAVRGAKDAVRDDGSIKSQSFCIYQLIPQLVSAIQELSAKVTALENA